MSDFAADDTSAYRSLAAGFRISRTGDALTVEGPFPPPGWSPRDEGDLVRSPFPGTAVFFGDACFEVVSEEMLRGARAVRFRLRPWNDSEVMRAPSELSVAACRRWAADRRAVRERERKAARLAALMPVVGLLPAADQLRIEQELGLHASRMTLLSAATVGVLTVPPAFIGLVGSFVSGFTAAYPELAWTTEWVVPLGYFALESWVRAQVAVSNGDALGSLPVVLAVSAWRLVRRPRRDQ